MKLTQNWVGYLDRSYEQIKRSVIQRMTVNNPEVNDHSETNPLIIILSFFSGIAEMLNYYIDRAAEESFLSTAKKYTSVVKLSRLINYNIKANWYSSVDILFTLIDSGGIPTTYAGGNILIPKGTRVSSNNGIVVQTLYDTYIITGTTSAVVTAAQFTEVLGENLGTTTGASGQEIPLPDDYVHNSLVLLIGTDFWSPVSSFGILGAGSKSFVVDIKEDGKAYVIFGDNVNGAVPAPGLDIIANYKVTSGSLGNLPPNSYTTLSSIVNLPDNNLSLRLTHSNYSSAGTDFEDMETIRRNAPLALRTLERAVTYQDYKDIAILEPGVGAAEVSYCCGKYVDIYIVPRTKGIATKALVSSVKDSFQCKKMITTAINVKPSGLTLVWVKAKVYAKPLFSPNKVLIDVINALDEDHGFAASFINKSVAISEISTTVELVSSVDRIEIEQVRIKPYVRPLQDTGTDLDIVFNSLPVTATRVKYTIVYITTGFQVYKEQYLIDTVALNGSYTDNVISFTLKAGAYSHQQSWEFVAFPSYPEIFPNNLIEIKDYTVPLIDIGPAIDANTPRTIYGDITVVGQSIQSSCLPPCQ